MADSKAVIYITGDASGLASAVQKAGASIQSLDKQVADLKSSFSALKGQALAALAALGFGDFAKQALDASLAMEKLDRTLRFSSSSAAVYGQNADFLKKTVKELGLDMLSAGGAFAKLAAASRGTALEGEGARSVFDAVARASTVMGLSSQETEGALLALQQMISKGTVQAEELRGQLGERLPGAFQIAARAVGVSTEKLDDLLKKGMIPAAEFLPRFAAQLRTELGGAVEEAANSTQAALNRMATAKQQAMIALQNADLTRAFIGGFTEFLEALPNALQKSTIDFKSWADEIAMIFAAVADVVTLPLRAFQNMTDDIGAIVAKWQLQMEKRAAIMRGDRAGANRAQEMSSSVTGGNRSMTPFADALRENRAAAANFAGPTEAERRLQMRLNQSRSDAALLSTPFKFGATEDKEALKEAERLRMLDQKGWVAWADAVIEEAERADRAMAQIFEERNKEEERLQQEGIKGWVAYADAVFEEAERSDKAMAEIFDQQEKEWQRTFKELGRSVKEATDWSKEFGLTMSSSLEEIITKGGSARDVIQALIQDIAKMAIRQLVTKPTADLVGAGIKALGQWALGTFGNTAPVNSGGWVSAEGGTGYGMTINGTAPRAIGGPVSAGSLYRVNESGMEYFRPNVDGQVIPMGQGGGGGNVVVNNNFMLGVQQTVQAEIRRLTPTIARTVEASWQARRAQGGGYARA